MGRTAIQVTTGLGMVLGVAIASLMLLSPEPETADSPSPAETVPAGTAPEAASAPAPDAGRRDSAPSSDAPAHEPLPDGDPGRMLGSMDPAGLADFYRFGRLDQDNRWLVMDDAALRVLEDLYQSRPADEIDAALDHIRDAAATQLEPQAADQFRTLVREYGDYTGQLAALDRERNLKGLTPEEVDVRGTLIRLQDRVFGPEKAEPLFRVRREAMALLEKHRKTITEDPESVSGEQIQRMKQEYRSLNTDDS